MEGDGDDVEEMEDLWYIRRLDNGLFTLQTVDYILAWIAMEDDGVSVACMLTCLALMRNADPHTHATNAATARQVIERYCKDS